MSSSIFESTNQTLRRNKQRKSLWNQRFQRLLVRVTGVEPAWPWSQTKCLTDRLHPDIQFWVIIPRSGRKSKFFLSVVIYVVKAVFGPVLLPGKIPQMPVFQGLVRFVRDCRGWSPNRSQSRRATNCATPGYSVCLSGWAYSPKPPPLPIALIPDICVSSL